MNQGQREFVIFLKNFAKYFLLVRHVVLTLLVQIVLGGVLISYLEDLKIGESIYFAFVTGLTIGYGDIEPVTVGGRVVSVVIGVVGMLFTGTSVAVATRALADTVKQVDSQSA